MASREHTQARDRDLELTTQEVDHLFERYLQFQEQRAALELQWLGDPVQVPEIRAALLQAINPDSRMAFEERLRTMSPEGRLKHINQLRSGYSVVLERCTSSTKETTGKGHGCIERIKARWPQVWDDIVHNQEVLRGI